MKCISSKLEVIYLSHPVFPCFCSRFGATYFPLGNLSSFFGAPCNLLGSLCNIFGAPCILLGSFCSIFGSPCILQGHLIGLTVLRRDYSDLFLSY